MRNGISILKRAYGVLAALLIAFAANAQTFDFNVRENSEKRQAAFLVGKTYPVSMYTVTSDMYTSIGSVGNTWRSKYKPKSINAFIKFYINHAFDTLVDSGYTYKLFFQFTGHKTNTSVYSFPTPTILKDSIVISYNPDSLSAYQDMQFKKYSGIMKIENLEVTNIKNVETNLPVGLNSAEFKRRLNFIIEGSIETQTYMKKWSNGNNLYGYNVVLACDLDDSAAAKNFIKVKWNYNLANVSNPPEITPANYELEWTYVDNYDGSGSTISTSSLNYNFRHNSTKVWLSNNYYRIPIIYESGVVVFRVRLVRPDSNEYRYPIYSKWSIEDDSGSVNDLTNYQQYYVINNAHMGDSLNWQYTVSFAEGGRYKQVLSYFDGLLKNRQTITRFNSNLSKLIATESIYDFEGRPSIKILPTPINSYAFRYQEDVSKNFYTSLPYKAEDFDTLRTTTCPAEYVPAPLASDALARIYYSNANPDTFDYHKFVPDAENYPFTQTIYAPENDNKIDRQGGAGISLQIGNGHSIANEYVGGDQPDLNQLFGLDAGWAGFYRKTVTKDQNGQYSMAVRDYKNKLVSTALLGTGPDNLTHAIKTNDIPDAKHFKQELITGHPQQTYGFTKVLDKGFYMDVDGNDSVVYEYDFAPFPTWCHYPDKYLSVKAHYNYTVYDNCGNPVVYKYDTIGTTGVVTSSATVTDSKLDTIFLNQGKHVIHKELTIQTDDIYAAVDAFVDGYRASCFTSEDDFIREEVLKRKFPCASEYEEDPCAKKKRQMIKDMYPITGKYGNFYWVDSVWDVVNGENSIFTWVEGLGYRYQDTCLHIGDWLQEHHPHAYKYWVGSFNTLKPSKLMEIFDDTIAEALLPLHPEYCRLLACFVDTFKERLEAIPDGIAAESQNLLQLSDIIDADLIVPRLMANPVNWTLQQVKDSLSRLPIGGGATLPIDTFVMGLAYCSCGDSVMFKTCMSHIFKDKIMSLDLPNAAVKNFYYKYMIGLYLTNRERFVGLLASGNGDSCGPCQVRRIQVVKPSPVFPVITDRYGHIDTSDISSIWKMFDTSSTVMNFETAARTIMTMQQDSLIKYKDSAKAVIDANNLVLCTGQIDAIVTKLLNCFEGDTILRNKLRDTLNAICLRGEIQYGNYKPEQILYALNVNSISLSDLCNPYLIAYDDYFEPSNVPTSFCRAPLFYEDIRSFLNRTEVMTVLKNAGGAGGDVVLSPSFNSFESDVKDSLGISNDTLHLYATYYSGDDLYTLFMHRDNDTMRLYFRSGDTTVNACDSIFYNPSTDSFVFTSIRCVNELGIRLGMGYIGSYGIIADIKRISGGGTTTCPMLAWNDRMEMVSQLDNKIANAVPCTQFRSLFSEFLDTCEVYEVHGIDHPNFSNMLCNFMSYRLRKPFTNTQYITYMESCALADSMLLKRYGAYSSFHFFDTIGANTFLDSLYTVDTQNPPEYPHYEYKEDGGEAYVYITLNAVRKEYLWKYKKFLTSYTDDVKRSLINQRLVAWQDTTTLGMYEFPKFAHSHAFFPYPPAEYQNPYYYNTIGDDDVFTQDYDDSLKFYYKDSVMVKTGATMWLPCYQYRLIRNAGLNKTDYIHRGIYYAFKFLATERMTILLLNNFEQTVNTDYWKVEKQNLLHYTYGRQSSTPARVLDSLSEDSLNTYVYPMDAATYTIPSNPGNTTDLFLATHSGLDFDTLFKKMMAPAFSTLSLMAFNEYGTYDDSTIFLPHNENHLLVIAGPPQGQLDIYRCSDESYLYRYFSYGNHKLYFAFVRMPLYIPRTDHHNWWVQDVLPMPDDDANGIRNFKIKLRHHITEKVMYVYGRASWSLGDNLTLKNVLLDHPINATAPERDTFQNCEMWQLQTAITIGKWRYKMYIDSCRQSLRDSLSAWVMGHLSEKLYIGYKDQRFAVTLYYYDRAGNLIKTVSPEGVTKLAQNKLTSVDVARKKDSTASALIPVQNKKSIYNYNSFNEVIYQKTPDGGEVDYYYDAAGRLIFSQNEKQRPYGYFTYNLYDKQGRIMETGQVSIGCKWFSTRRMADSMPPPGSGTVDVCYVEDFEDSLYIAAPRQVYYVQSFTHDSIINYVRAMFRTEIVLTIYDTAAKDFSNITGFSNQENLRKRVSSVRYIKSIGSSSPYTSPYEHAAFYSYDIAGNVKTLTHDFPLLQHWSQRYKRVDYDYDVISGKVNLLSYNRGWGDQFYQRYSYDDDNRITKVETSNDGFIWKRDAEYDYYQHGPLARMRLGDLNVQGVDYVYTVQGWLKAINSDVLDTTKDIGDDGKYSSVQAKDAFALSLQYFEGDYKPIASDTALFLPPRENRDLFNGNISRQTVSIVPLPGLASDYIYDQLNRIYSADYDSIMVAKDSLYKHALNGSYLYDYKSRYWYDWDGNLTRMTRWGNSGLSHVNGTSYLMDTLNYFYKTPGSANRLRTVTDVATDRYIIDIKKDTATMAVRYEYDPTGNVIKDMVAGQDEIKWNHYNKVVTTDNKIGKNTLTMYYDGAGNRVGKVYNNEKDTLYYELGDYYIRDAQGNILAVYRSDAKYKYNRLAIFIYADSMIINGPSGGPGYGGHTFIDNLPYFIPLGPLAAGVCSTTVSNPGWFEPTCMNYDVSFFSTNNSAILSNMLFNGTDYIAPLLDYDNGSVVADAWQRMFEQHSTAGADILNWTTGLFSNSGMRETLMELMCDADGTGGLTDYMKDLYGTAAGANCDETADNIAAEISDMPDLASYLIDASINKHAEFNTYLSTLASSASVAGNSAYFGSGGSMIATTQTDLYTYGSRPLFYTFLDQWTDAREYLDQVTTPMMLAGTLFDYDPFAYMKAYGDDMGYNYMDTVLANITDLSVASYLGKIADKYTFDAEEYGAMRKLLQTEDFYLAEHDIYGNSRLGIKQYPPGEIFYSANYIDSPTHPQVIQLGLNQTKSWYSADMQNNILAGALAPWGTQFQNEYMPTHIIGQRLYELTNHLGNVQAVVKDKRLYKAKNADSNLVYRPSLHAIYDYYPFGMLMPGRYSQDTDVHCITIFHPGKGIYKYNALQIPGGSGWSGFMMCPGGYDETCNAQPLSAAEVDIAEDEDGAYLTLATEDPGDGVERLLEITQPDVEHDLYLEILALDGDYNVIVSQYTDSGWVELSSSAITSTGPFMMSYTPSTLNARFQILHNGAASTHSELLLRGTFNAHTEEEPGYSYTVCDKPRDSYRYGHNGHEKDNEIAGIGNFNYALHWEQDTRTGRRWNSDPKPNPSWSPYSTFSNNSLWYNDRLGDTTIAYNTSGEKLGTINDGLKNEVHYYKTDVENGKKFVSYVNNLKPNERNAAATVARKYSVAYIGGNSAKSLEAVASKSLSLNKEAIFVPEISKSREILFRSLKIPPSQEGSSEASPKKTFEYNNIQYKTYNEYLGMGHTHITNYSSYIKLMGEEKTLMRLGTPTNSTQWERSTGDYDAGHDYKNHLGIDNNKPDGYFERTTPLFIGSPLGISIYNNNTPQGGETILRYNWFK